jgi:hypothetical protein
MEFKEALALLKEGKKVRRHAWDKTLHLKQVETELTDSQECKIKTIRAFAEFCIPYHFDTSILLSDDWIVEEEPNNFLTFDQAIDEVKKNKKVKLAHWRETYLCIDGNNFYIRKIGEHNFTPTVSCFIANDWEVIE